MRCSARRVVAMAAGVSLALLVVAGVPSAAHAEQARTARPMTDPATVVNYLKSIEGNHTVSGQHNAEPNSAPTQYTDQVDTITGVYPGLWGGDFLYESDSIAARQTMIGAAKAQWAAGSLITLMWHECPPTMTEPCSWSDVESKLTDTRWNELITDGTSLNNAWKSELDIIVPYLQQLKDAGIPVLWRPLHENNSGWSWWGGTQYSAALWRLTHDYLVGVKGLSNLIWVWSAKDDGDPGQLAADYPGDQYVDVVALDPWNNGFPTTAWYQAVQSIAAPGGKPIALAETGILPTPDELASQPDWTYFNEWASYLTGSNNDDQIKATYYDSQVLHQGDIHLGG